MRGKSPQISRIFTDEPLKLGDAQVSETFKVSETLTQDPLSISRFKALNLRKSAQSVAKIVSVQK